MPSTVTDYQIRGLLREAAAAGDLEQVAICYRALGLDHIAAQARMAHAEARTECARVIADNLANVGRRAALDAARRRARKADARVAAADADARAYARVADAARAAAIAARAAATEAHAELNALEAGGES